MNIVITMAGEGSRFKAIGYNKPKHLIEVRGKTLFEWSLLSLQNFFDEHFIFICRTSHESSSFISEYCKNLGIKSFEIKEIESLTGGQADTALLAADLVESLADEVMIYNIDTYVEPSALDPKDVKGDGWVPAFEAEGDRWSFVSFNDDLEVSKITEKVRISNYGTIGLYYFSSFNLYKHCYDTCDFQGNSEKYIAPMYDVLIKDPSKKLYTHLVDPELVHVLGTPEDVREFCPEFV